MGTFVYSYNPTKKNPRRTRIMSIDPVGGGSSSLAQLVEKVREGLKSTLDKPLSPVGDNKPEGTNNTLDTPLVAPDENRGAKFDCCSNAEDFMTLRNGLGRSGDDRFAVLDEVIEELKEEVEQMGEVMDLVTKRMKEVSDESVGLSILKKTFEAIDKYRNNSEL